MKLELAYAPGETMARGSDATKFWSEVARADAAWSMSLNGRSPYLGGWR